MDKEKKTKTKLKPRGKPFPKGNSKGKSLEHGQIELFEMVKNEITIPILKIEPQKEPEKEIMTPPAIQIEPDTGSEPWEILDEIKFSSGENELTIRFIKRANRTYRVKVFLNDEMEIRPATYTGASTAEPFWNLLKRSLKS